MPTTAEARAGRGGPIKLLVGAAMSIIDNGEGETGCGSHGDPYFGIY